MTDIIVTGLSKSFEQDRVILDNISFQVEAGERVGLLGTNGTGKTTLLRILTGELSPDAGEVRLAPGKRLGLISQIPVYPAQYTVEDVLKAAFERIFEAGRELERLRGTLGERPEPEQLRRYDALTMEFEAGGGYEWQVRLNKVAAGLSMDAQMRARLFSALSGGEQTRVNLGRLILEDTDILLLDEPTNHLDMDAIEWLEGYLEQFKGTVLAISHDRYFLDRAIRRAIELEGGKLSFYAGNYSFYVQEKQARYQEQLRRYEKEQSKISQLSFAAERMHGWGMGNAKLQKRAFAMDKRIERLRQTERPTKQQRLSLRFGEREFHGDEALVLEGFSKAYGEKTLFQGAQAQVAGGERIALLGPNGAGKTTLLRILMGEEAADGGYARFGPSVKWGYLPQQVRFDHPERTLVDTMLYEQNCTTQEARDRLGAFRFSGEDAFKRVSQLSGGERSRLRLCMLMDEKINLLILDEPTNHLDLASREWIEEAVESFEGTLLFVSHDRYFIERFATRVWELREGRFFDWPCTFAQYRMRREAERQQTPALQQQKQLKSEPEKPKRKDAKAGRKLSVLEREIAAKEAELAALDGEMEAAACDYMRLNELAEQKEAGQAELDAMYEEWAALAEE